MPRNFDRERWEAFLMIMLVANRPILFIGGFVLLLYAIAAITAYPWISCLSGGFAVLLFLIVFSDRIAQIMAWIGAWLATFNKKPRDF